ncbi:hypothetical protein J7J47_03620 [Halomonas sp. ISL-60]|uniref:hypothetical protein n=1 Tax=Halomonas sp. ISL-56 TaxID=2819149 RepID=UPI001BE862DC|nr:hypothetical protein [Halomonas sp. ISL-56]MBT2771318.1 hypothetical protein [Halomonas sp. ISL-60]MBT2800675.1 hypothetical protein [Halomonas sp. ISL-56]
MKFDVEKLMNGLRSYIDKTISTDKELLVKTIESQAAVINELKLKVDELESTESVFEIDESQITDIINKLLLDTQTMPDINFEFDGERTLSVTVNDQVKTFEIPAQIYQGVHIENEEYHKGDTVTHQGALWHCKQITTEKPGQSEHWQLAVKSGRK